MITLVLSAPFLLINLTDGSVPSPLESSSGCCSIVDLSETGATDDIGDPNTDIQTPGDPGPSATDYFLAGLVLGLVFAGLLSE